MSGLIACLDAAYSETASSAACALAPEWNAATPSQVLTYRQGAAAAYEPGQFYKRELPLLLGVVGQVGSALAAIVIDGYAWLDANDKAGLGAILHERLAAPVPVVGVAKTSFGDSSWCIPVMRGDSRRPLFVSAIGIDPQQAAEHVRTMHGPHRIPTLLRFADRAARVALG